MAQLYNFQKEGVRFIERKKGRALIADEQGLGKTVQALGYLYRNLDALPAVVVCPSSLKINWRRETKRWLKCDVKILYGTIPKDIPQKSITIINYDILNKWTGKIIQRGFNTMILDEAHKIKNSKAIRTKAVFQLNRYCKNVIALTGTPIENRPVELYNIIRLLKPALFPNFFFYAHRYCAAKRTAFGWDFSGASNMKELHQILTHHVMIRRLKKDVLTELPPKMVCTVPMQIDNRSEYVEAEQNFMKYISDKFEKDVRKLAATISKDVQAFKKMGIDLVSDADIEKAKQAVLSKSANAPVLVQIEVLKQIAVKGKMAQMIKWIEDFVETGEKLVVFAHHQFVIQELMDKFGKIAVKLDGKSTEKQRQHAVDSFQTNPNTKLFFGNLEAAGVGITLTKASNAAVAEFPWSPSKLNQAEDRIHRITQTKQVTIYNFVGANTIEDDIIKLLEEKKKVIGQVLDGNDAVETSILTDLINIFRQ